MNISMNGWNKNSSRSSLSIVFSIIIVFTLMIGCILFFKYNYNLKSLDLESIDICEYSVYEELNNEILFSLYVTDQFNLEPKIFVTFEYIGKSPFKFIDTSLVPISYRVMLEGKDISNQFIANEYTKKLILKNKKYFIPLSIDRLFADIDESTFKKLSIYINCNFEINKKQLLLSLTNM
ncbi:MAG: hypothetical protein JXR88_18510 [Clostridia bacterium]|nr:hypothetical protein [Clostridia bacterium]